MLQMKRRSNLPLVLEQTTQSKTLAQRLTVAKSLARPGISLGGPAVPKPLTIAEHRFPESPPLGPRLACAVLRVRADLLGRLGEAGVMGAAKEAAQNAGHE